MNIRSAAPEDADAISAVTVDLFAAGKRSKPADAAFILSPCIHHPERIRCSVAVDDGGRILGFQSLKIATTANPYRTPAGWGIIGTHVRPLAARMDVGRSLFASSLEAARAAGLTKIEAYIGADNAAGLTYYEAMGFRTYHRAEGVDCKAYDVAAAAEI